MSSLPKRPTLSKEGGVPSLSIPGEGVLTVRVPAYPQIAHGDGCPAGRVEVYNDLDPAGQTVSISRCLDCGGEIVTRATRMWKES